MSSLQYTGPGNAPSFVPFGTAAPTNGMYLPATNTIAFATNSTEAMRITSSRTLLIGATAQAGYSGTVPTAEVYGASVASTDVDGGTVAILGTANTAGSGGAIALGSLFNTGAYATYGRIRGAKVNGTAGDFSGGLAFDTRANAGNFAQAMVIDASGNLMTFKAVADQSYSKQTPTTGFAITIANNTQTLILTPAGTLASGTVTMPATPIDGQIVYICSTQIITTLTISPNTGQSLGDAFSTTLGAGAGVSYIYVLSTTTWYKRQ